MRIWLAASVGLFALPWPGGRAAEPADTEFFEKRIRPVLVEHCYECHSAQSKKQKGGLRLDTREALRRGGDSGVVIVPGNPDASLFIKALRYANPDLKMPPKAKLPPRVIADFEAWVKLGAPDPRTQAGLVPVAGTSGDAKRHWAFQPVQRPAIPDVRQRDWPRTPIDRFVLARLEAAGLSPSPGADKRTLIRRVTFDLIGLPPTPEDIAAFEADNSPHAFANVVDRLLASPRYGERWGRYWLDVARFADTKGYVFFQDASYPWAYTYRDYVIRAFNDDLPYDRFIMEQLAADKLGDQRALTALGFLVVGGRFMSNIHDILDDRIDVVTRGLMGLTVGCARCHDHKFDPISTQDYYGLYGVFASSVEPEVPPLFEPPPKTPEYEKFRIELETREKKLTDFTQAQFDKVVTEAKTRVAEYLLAVHAQGDHPAQDDFMLIADGTDLNPKMLNRWRARIVRARRQHDPVLAPWLALSDLPEKEFAAKAKELAVGWALRPDASRPINPLVAWSFAAKPPATVAEAAKRYGELLNDADRLWQEARKSNPALAHLPDPAMEQLRLVFSGPGAPANLARSQIDDLELIPDRPGQAKLQELRKAVEQWRITGAGAPPRAHALVDVAHPVEPRVFLRGNPNQPGPAARRQMPVLLQGPTPHPFQTGSGRLDLAKAIVDPANPLTARVFVNRVWQQHFGQGLVRTPADFGVRSEPPSHPELLDYLATEFIHNGWSVKKLHRLILLSATYQQHCDERPDCQRSDPENRLVWCNPRRRLDFESTRDALLAVSGRLDARIGGPSVKDLLAPVSTRRTLYGFVDRLQVPGLYRVFDFPSPDATAAQRDLTTTPQQALFVMNSPFVAECARAVLRRPEVAKLADVAQRVDRIYRLCFGRAATSADIALAREYLGDGAGPAWERYVQALLETNEFVFVD